MGGKAEREEREGPGPGGARALREVTGAREFRGARGEREGLGVFAESCCSPGGGPSDEVREERVG